MGMLSLPHMPNEMPFRPPEAAAGPEKKREPKSLTERKIGLLEKLSATPYAFALTALMAINSQAGCEPFRELPPMAADVGIRKSEVNARKDRCDTSWREAREILNDIWISPKKRERASEAYLKFKACSRGLEHGVWDEKTYQEAESALAAAKHMK